MTTPEASAYEAKRLRRMAENRQKLQELQLPHGNRDVADSWTDPGRPSRPHQRTRNRDTTIGGGPTRRSLRLRNVQRGDPGPMLETDSTRGHQWTHERGHYQPADLAPRSGDWRTRRKVAARDARRQATEATREATRARRRADHAQLRQRTVQERKRRKRQQETRRLEQCVEKELELQRRIEEGERMRAEDRLARHVAKQMVHKAQHTTRHETHARLQTLMAEIEATTRRLAREKADARNKALYPVQKLELPLVHLADPMDSSKQKPVVPSSRLRVDVTLFHAFSLGKQFLPPGKQSVMQGLCPGGVTTAYQDHVDIYVWKNAMTLFIRGTTGMFYRYMFQEVTHHGRDFVFFRWTRSREVTPSILWRMCRMQKGADHLQWKKSDDDARTPTRTAEPLLLFVQYPQVLTDCFLA